MPTQTGSIDFKSTKGFQSYASGQYTTKTEFNSLEIGGRNLLPYSTPSADNIAKVSTANSYNTFVNEDGYLCYKITNGATNGAQYASNAKLIVKLEADTQYTYSAWVKLTTTASVTSVALNFGSLGHFTVKNDNSSASDKTHEDVASLRIYSPTTVPIGEWTKIKLTFTTNSLDGSYFGVYPKYSLGNEYTLFIRDEKLEKGNKATDWSPAPEDTTERIVKAETAIEQTANNVLIKATQSDTTAAQGGQHLIESLINVAPSGVKIAASKVEIDGTAVFKAANAIPDTRSNNQPPSWYFTNYPRQSVTEFKTSSVMGLTGETYCYVTTVTGWNDKSGGYPKQTAQIAGKTYWRVGVSDSAWGTWQETESTAGSQAKVDALEIGGRNLFLNSGSATLPGTANQNNSYTTNLTVSEFVPAGTVVTVSCQIDATNLAWGSSGNKRAGVEFSVGSSSYQYIGAWAGAALSESSNVVKVVTGTWSGRISKTATLQYDLPKGRPYAVYVQMLGSGTCTVSKPKLEIGNKATDWTPAPEDVASSIDSVYDKIRSQGIQLVTNGNGFMRDNTNWPGLRFDGSKANGSPGSFTKSVGYTTIFSEEAFPVDVSKEYLFEFDAMSAGGTGVLYSFLATLDSDKNLIDAFNVMYYQNTLTTLASDLNPGDTTVKLTSAANFVTTTATHQRTLTFWDYSNSSGYTYPAETYSRNVYSNIYADDSKVNKSTGVITLKSAWTGPKKTAGTQVSQGHSGSTYNYSHVGIKIPSTWTHYSALISGLDTVKDGSDASGKFRQGTAFGKIGFLWNYNNSNQGQIWVTNISVKEASANLSSSVKRTQRIWYRKSAAGAPATPGTASSNWVVKADDGSNAWTKMHISITETEKFIYTCEQYEMGDGTVGYTSVLLDNTITVIDGGDIITGSVTANQIAASTITGEEIAANTIDGNNIKGSTITAEHLSSAFSLDLGKVEGLKERLESVEQGVSGVQTDTQWVHFDQSVGTVFGREGSTNNVTITNEGIDFNTDEGRAAWATGGVFHANEMEADTVDTRTVVMGDWALVQSGTTFYIDYIGS